MGEAALIGRRDLETQPTQVRLRIDTALRRSLPVVPNQETGTLVTVGLLVALQAKPGREEEVASFLRGALPLVQQEAQTTAWFALRLGASRFAIFDAFADEAGREADLAGQVAAALMEHAPELLAEVPSIETADVIADKLAL